MRISLAKKIYFILFVPVVVAVAIAIASLWSFQRLTEALTNLALQSKRTVNMSVIHRIALERRSTAVAIIDAVDEASMKALIDDDFRRTEDEMRAELRAYLDNNVKPAPPVQVQFAEDLRNLWQRYVTVTDTVAELALENTNNRALRIGNDLVPFWNDMDAEFELLAVHLTEKCQDFTEYTPLSRTRRVHLIRFRREQAKYV
ncbi:MAG: MCP four helix bundle domain-containing protein, partial [Planctomycetes bacterium]|nr:MCP four helix bundle domain-containing protein [Planctomycetota bacterium]